MSRSLSIIPIVHSEADLGGIAEHLREQIGAEAWADKQQAVGEVWARIETWANGIDADSLRLYQDGLPNTESEGVPDRSESIVRDLAKQGSANHRILRSLMDRGAVLVGTEDTSLLLREYEIAKAAAEAIHAGRRPDPRDSQRSATLLARRDQAIARRIDKTLPDRGRGVLFVGMLHDVESQLAPDIRLSHPLGKPSQTPSGT